MVKMRDMHTLSARILEGGHMEIQDLDTMIILRLIFKGTVCENSERIRLAQARVQRDLRFEIF